MLALLQAIWLKGSKVTYVTKELMLVVMIVEEGNQVNWSVFLFNNLYCRIGDCSASSKSKETTGKESEFGPAQVVDILPRKWFPLELEKRLPDSDSEDENDDLEFFNLDSEMKSTSLEVLVEGASIDLDSISDE
jgi:hypothetical protein